MKKKLTAIIMLFSLIFLVSCGQKETSKTAATETDADSALMYTFTMDDHDYRFRLLDGWIKYPNSDTSIAFLVGNKNIKSFMTAGFEPKDKSLVEYKDDFEKKLKDNADAVVVSNEMTQINGLDSYAASFTKKDTKDRTLTYHMRLIETDGYFVNLTAWTSEEKPSEKTLSELDKILETFEQLK